MRLPQTLLFVILAASCHNKGPTTDTTDTDVADTDTDTDADSDTDADTDTDADSDTDTDTDSDTDADVPPPGSFVSLTSGGGSGDAGGMHMKVAIDGQSYGVADGGGYHLVLGPVVPVP